MYIKNNTVESRDRNCPYGLRFTVRLITVLIIMSFSVLCYSQFAGGSGTEEDPWQIATPEHLDNIRDYISEEDSAKHYIQTADICLLEYLWDEETDDLINEGLGWRPLGGYGLPAFRGTYDGNGFTINGLIGIIYLSLFGGIDNSELRNITLTNISGHADLVGCLVNHSSNSVIDNCHTDGLVTLMAVVAYKGGLAASVSESLVVNSSSSLSIVYFGDKGLYRLGGLIGYMENSEVKNCSFNGKILVKSRGASAIGGIVANLDQSTIKSCVNEGDIAIEAVSSSSIGGLVGSSQPNRDRYSSITNSYNSGNVIINSEAGGGMIGGVAGGLLRTNVYSCYNTGTVNGHDNIGGLIGGLYNSNIKQSYSTGVVNGNNKVGGLVGEAENGSIINSYARGNVSGKDFVAGLVASIKDNRVENSYSTGKVTGLITGGLIAKADGFNMFNSYWDTETSEQTESAGGYARQTIHLTYPYDEYAFIDWDFDLTWKADLTSTVNDGYPLLGWQPVPYPDIALNPDPEDNDEIVNVDLSKLSWNYTPSPQHVNPIGFRVYLNTTGEFDEEDEFEWVEYIEGEENYLCSDILPQQLEGLTTYYWKVVPTLNEPTGRAADHQRRNSQRYEQESVLSLHFSGDAQEVPVWSFTTIDPTNIEADDIRPYATELSSNYPNPFNPETVISFSLAEAGEVSLEIYNIKGQKVATLINSELAAGYHQVIWNGRDDRNLKAGSTVYFYRMKSGAYSQVRKMIMIK